MPRRLDHLVICVRDLAQAALDWQTLGFSLTPTGVHPFGTSNRLAMFGNNFLELLAVTDVAAVPPAASGRFSFAALVLFVTGSLAGLYPAWLASRAPIAATLRAEAT